MKYLLLLLLSFNVLLLSACGSDGHLDNNHGYGFEYDYIDEDTGLRLRYIDVPHYAALSEFVAAYLASQDCTGLYGVGPLVIVTGDKTFNHSGKPASAEYFWETNTILLPSYVFADNREFKFYLFWHEAVHHLLQANSFDHEKNDNHESSLFADCTKIYP